MPKHNGTESKKGKGSNTKKTEKVIKKKIKKQFTLEQKAYACELKSEGKKQKDILKALKEKYGITPCPSTLSTFYNAKNKVRYEKFGQKDSCMASVETSINNKQRPTIVIDMEFSLLTMLKKTLNIGKPVTKACIKKMALDIYNRLRALQLYDDSGERHLSLGELTEEHMRKLLYKTNTNCLICQAEILDGHEALLDHLKEYHVALAVQTGRDETGGSPATNKAYTFTASDGWVKNFLRRHNMHNVATVGEMGSSDHEAAQKYVEGFRNELIERGISPRKIVEILMNIDETGIVFKSIPKRTYKVYGQTFHAKKCIKDRVTVLVGTTMDGFKLKPVVIGKAQNPRALRGMDMDNLPVHYYGQPSAWMDREIMAHWFMWHFDEEIRRHYGDNLQVILTLDNAGCHPPDLNLSSSYLDYVEVRYLPPNTTPIIQPMDQGVIYTFKKAFMAIYYNQMIEHVIQNPDAVDPMKDFSKNYNMKNCIMDIGQAWETIEKPLIHKCFESLVCPNEYLKQYNETYNVSEEWPGVNFRGFDATDNNHSATERAGKIKALVDMLNNRQDHVLIDSDSVREAIEYDPHEDMAAEELILNGFYTQRLADGMLAADNDTGINIHEKAHESLKALYTMSITFRPDDFPSNENAKKAKEYMEGLQVILRKMKAAAAPAIASRSSTAAAAPPAIPSTSSTAAPPAIPSTSSTAAAPAIPSTSSTEAASVNLTAPITSPISVSFSFDEENVVHVSLGEGDVADDVLMASTSDHESSTASANLTPRSASPAPVNDVLMATPDHESSTAAAARAAAAPAISLASATAAAAASGMWVSPSKETILVARFTALNPPDATSSPSQTRKRPTRAGAKESRGKYTEIGQSSSEETLEENSDEEYKYTKGK